MRATSVSGTSASHSAATNPGRSSRIGLSSTNSAPRSRAARRWSRARMPAGAAGAHHRVLDRDAAEADEQLGVPLEHRPRRGPIQELAHRSDDVRHDDGLGAVAVGVLTAHVAAQAVEEPVELALRVVEAAGAAPAVRAAVDGRAAVPLVHTRELARQHPEGRRPAHGHEGLGAPVVVGSRPSIQPSGADHRLGDPRRMPQAVDDVAA